MISKVVEHMDAEYDAETVYGDTDSVFVRMRRALDGVSAMGVRLVGCAAASLDQRAFGAAVARPSEVSEEDRAKQKAADKAAEAALRGMGAPGKRGPGGKVNMAMARKAAPDSAASLRSVDRLLR